MTLRRLYKRVCFVRNRAPSDWFCLLDLGVFEHFWVDRFFCKLQKLGFFGERHYFFAFFLK